MTRLAENRNTKIWRNESIYTKQQTVLYHAIILFLHSLIHSFILFSMWADDSRPSTATTAVNSTLEFLEKPIYDPTDPHTWSKTKRWSMTLILSFVAFMSFWPSGAYAPGITHIRLDFGVSQEIAVLGTAFYPLGFTLGPLLGAPLSELYGRRIVLLVCIPFTIAAACGVALSCNIYMVLVFRLVTAVFISGPFAVTGGAVSDLWTQRERAVPIIVFSTAPNLASTLGVVVGGFTNQYLTWHYTFWIQVILLGIAYVLVVLFVPESYTPVLRKEKARNSIIARAKIKTAMVRPFALLFTEPIVFMLSVYLAFVYGLLFCSFSAYPVEFELVRGWNVLDATLPFLAIGAGIVLGAFTSLGFRPLTRKNPTPEGRLYQGCAGALLLPISLFWWALTSGKEVHPASTITAGVGIGASLLLLFLAITDYLVETYLTYAASALAANGAFRTAVSTAFPLFSHQMFVKLTPIWAMCVLGFISLALLPIPFILIKFGARIRGRGKYATK